MDARRVAGWIIATLGGFGLIGITLAALLAFVRASSPGMGLLYFVAYGASAVLPLAFLLVGWRLAHPRPLEPASPRARREPVPAVDVSEAEQLPLPVSACPECGFLGIRMPTIHDGLWPGGGETGARMVCPRCDWQGLPARFDTGAQYAAFVRELHEPADAARAPAG